MLSFASLNALTSADLQLKCTLLSVFAISIYVTLAAHGSMQSSSTHITMSTEPSKILCQYVWQLLISDDQTTKKMQTLENWELSETMIDDIMNLIT